MKPSSRIVRFGRFLALESCPPEYSILAPMRSVQYCTRFRGSPKRSALPVTVQPGGSLFGLQESNPVDTGVAYGGNSGQYGTSNDPMTGKKIGGVNVFGGGLALYGDGKQLLGGVGVSGDTSCADHMIGWRVRHYLKLDHLAGVGGVSGDPARPDNIIYDIHPNPSGGTGNSAGGFGHPTCVNTGDEKTLPPVQP